MHYTIESGVNPDAKLSQIRRLLKALAWSLRSAVAVAVLSVVAATLQTDSYAQSQKLENLRVWHSPDNTRIVFDVSASTEYKTFKLDNPLRLAVDLERTNLSVKLPEVQPNNRHLKAIRSGNPQPGMLRVVFDLRSLVDVNSFVLTPNELYGHRLVIDLTDPLPAEQAKPAATQAEPGPISEGSNSTAINVQPEPAPVQSNNPPALVAQPRTSTRFTVAIDAGHGGDDPGALGHRGTFEKKITLSIAKELQKRINQNPRMQAVMVRTSDYYITLKGRRAKARELNADVFISIHADAFTKKSAHGMSVFALSQRGATSTMASTLAAKENASDLIGGVNLADKDEVLAKVLVDLSMTNTISESVNLGGRVLKELSKLGKLHSKRVEQANFSVLRSPDMPSILVETGFITNPEEERRLRSRKHQAKVANAIYLAVNDYLEQTPYASRAVYDSPDIGGTSARPSGNAKQIKYGRHRVVRGDTLSDIAQKYGISTRELKRLNNIRHNTAMLGVRLKVPISSANADFQSSQKGSGSANKVLVYKVKNGDSLSKISAKYNVTIRAIKRANGLTKNTLRKGQSLTIPGVTQAQVSKHKVRRGDTLSEIAEQYGSSVAKIKSANKLRSNTVRLGQVLTIPN